MVRLYLFAEGQTEQTFADNVLKPHLASHGVYLNRPILIAHARKKGKVHRGGGRRYEPMRNDIRRLLAQEKSGDVFFTSMIDLYAIGRNFPGLDEADGLKNIPYQRVEFLQNAWGEDVDDSRFIPFIQLHEYEAYLFSKPSEFALFYDGAAKPIANLEAIVDKFDGPELIDDGEHTAPSKRIAAEFPDYGKAKATIGPQVGELIGLQVIRGKCPHFDRWLTRLERLGQAGDG